MKTIIAQCDRCGRKETIQPGKTREMKLFGVGYWVDWMNRGYPPNFQYEKPLDVQEWCRDCMVKVGIVPPSDDAQKKIAPPTPPTLEEKLVELLREFIHENTPTQQ